MADIAFLLLVFFLATTVVHSEQGVPVRLPAATRGMELPREHVAELRIGANGDLALDGDVLPLESLRSAVAAKRENDPNVTIALLADADVRNELVHRVLAELRAASVTDILLTHELESARN
jgi:biopolymer transport protein ExbD